jgi:hypothetical protein
MASVTRGTGYRGGGNQIHAVTRRTWEVDGRTRQSLQADCNTSVTQRVQSPIGDFREGFGRKVTCMKCLKLRGK